ncbi:hypothetical protein [Mesobacillus jeotgali]|uniref:hypothetical protein n=1 Tax=Mesobacillus jeotgali TaxID=129985 RepID=UPI0009A8A27B|nr:hypothetical protein [Mesobacillus jeotgali]
MKNIKKLVKTFVATTVLSFGIISGGHFTEAAAPDQANNMQNLQGIEKASSVTSATPKKAELTVQPKEETKPEVTASTAEAKPEVTAPKAEAKPEADTQTETAEKAVDPSQSKKADAQLKKENKVIKSQAGLHASENARMHAAENSAIFANSPTEEEKETEVQTEYYYGTDSATAIPNPSGDDFYLGKLGYGSVVQFDASTGSGKFFSSARAEDATYVYGYWFLTGIQQAPAGISASEWGVQQAKLALETYEAMKSVYGSKVRPVIFIDVEPASTGTKEYDYANNQAIYTAFVNYLNQYEEGVKPGTYSSKWSWEVSMGEFSPSTPGAYWVAYYPGDIPEDLTISNPDWGNFPGTTEKAQIWQYYGGENDYNVAWKLP